MAKSPYGEVPNMLVETAVMSEVEIIEGLILSISDAVKRRQVMAEATTLFKKIGERDLEELRLKFEDHSFPEFVS